MKMLRDRSVRLGVVLAAVITAGFTSQTLAQTQLPLVDERTQVATSRPIALHAIQQRVTLLIDEAELSDVLRHIESITSIRFEPMWISEIHAGLSPESLISLDVEDRPLQEVIGRLLEQIGNEYDSADWQIGNDGRVQIGPKSRLNERTSVVLFDLHDVLFTFPDFVDVPEIDLQAAMQQSQGSPQVPFQNPGEGETLEPIRRDVDEVVDLLTTFVEPEQWRRNGGEGAMMSVWNSQLIVKAPRYVLRGIEGLL